MEQHIQSKIIKERIKQLIMNAKKWKRERNKIDKLITKENNSIKLSKHIANFKQLNKEISILLNSK